MSQNSHPERPKYEPQFDAYKAREVIAQRIEYLGYNPDSELVEIMDDYEIEYEKARENAQKTWVKTHNVESPFNVGDKVRYRSQEYYVVSCKPLLAQHLLSKNKEDTGGLVCNYEEMELIETIEN